MDKKAKNTMIVSVIALALVLIGVTYAYFSARITGLESASTITLTAGRMGIQYSEDDATVTANNIYPREEAWVTKTITLTGWNTTNQAMNYDLGFNIITNTFLNGELTFDLIGVGENGTKIADISGKSITKTSGFFKIGTGKFLQSNGDTHVYTLKIYFKDTGEDQNYNQEAVFNAKIDVRERAKELLSCQIEKKVYDMNSEVCLSTFENWYLNNEYTEPSWGEILYRYEDLCADGIVEGNEGTNWTIEMAIQDLNMTLEDAITNNILNGYTVELENNLEKYESMKYVNGQYSYNYYSSANGGYWQVGLYDDPIDDGDDNLEELVITSDFCHSINGVPVTSAESMFQFTQAPVITGLNNIDTSDITDMRSMFYGSEASTLDLSSFDTSNVTDMADMFAESKATSIIGLDRFDTSNVTNMMTMFSNSKATALDLSSFDTSKVINMNSMFSGSSATSIDLSSFDTSSVTMMSQMLSDTKALTLDVSSFNTSKVDTMAYMFSFSKATSIVGLDNFDTSNVTNLYGMFKNSNAATLDLSSFDTSKATGMGEMFRNAKASTIYASNLFVVSNPSAYLNNVAFDGAVNLVGGSNTTYDSSRTDIMYARIDGGPSNPGYFTAK